MFLNISLVLCSYFIALVTENEMLNEFEDGIAADIDKMPAESFEETENQLQQAPLDEKEPTDEAEQEEEGTCYT